MNPLLPSDQKNLLSLSGIEMSGLSLKAATKERRKAGVGLSQKRRSWVKPVCAGDVRPDTEQGVVSRVKTLCYLCYLLFKFSLFTSISDDVASLKRKGCSAKLVQLLFLFRSQSTQVLVLGMIVDFVGGLDIGA